MNKPLYSTPPDRNEVADDAPDPKAPKFGCIMLSLLLAFFTGAMIFAIVQGGRMYKEMLSFTEDEPVEIPADRGTPEELKAIREKVAAFIKAVTPKEPPLTELVLSARELNILIANDNYLADIRGRFYIDDISDGLIHTRASRPRRHLVFWKPKRYLNAEIDLRPEAAEGQFFLRVADVRIDNGTIHEGILSYMRTEDLLEMYKNDERFEDIVKKINSARIENGSLIVSTATDSEAAAKSADKPEKPAAES